jgi:hypothetical protein
MRVMVYDTAMRLLYARVKKFDLFADASTKVFDLGWKIPSGFNKKVFFVYLKIEKGNKTLGENLYWQGTSAYTRPDNFMELGGIWQVQAGKKARPSQWRNTAMPSYWKKPPQAPPPGESLFYKKTVRVPLHWKGVELELYCQGFEGNDEVFFNGRRIGRTEEEVTVKMGTDARVFSETGSAGTKKAAQKGGQRNIRVSSDPFTVPNLIKRFYAVPKKLIRWGRENRIEVRLFGKHATGISEPVFLRQRTAPAQKKAVIKYDNGRAWLAQIGKLPMVRVKADVWTRGLVLRAGAKASVDVTLENPGKQLAFYTGLKLSGVDNELVLIYSDNYFALLPGAKKRVRVTLVNNQDRKGRLKARFKVWGWNVKSGSVGKPFRIQLR